MREFNFKPFLKKHLFFMFFGGVFLLLILISGLVVANYFNDVQYLVNMPRSNEIYFIVWRSFLYLLLFFSWKSFIDYLSGRQASNVISVRSLSKLYAYRYKVILYCLIFELFVVQNVIAHLMGWILSNGR